MGYLRHKTILVLSPQRWGIMFLTKHHYALELARRGNRVYFINPPEPGLGGPSKVEIRPHKAQPGLFIVEHRLFFPASLRFHWGGLYARLMAFHLRTLLGVLPGPIDVVWSFDQNNLYPLSLFPAGALKIFHPVDEPRTALALRAARGASLLFSVTREILDQYRTVGTPAYWIGHGVSSAFFEHSAPARPANRPLRVGMAGNFTRTFIDFPVLLAIVRRHPDVIFECWGSYRAEDSNVGGGSNDEVGHFIEALEKRPNVVLHGPVPSARLARELHRMDLFLVCYDVQKDQSRGTNYHKLLEYLSTGKVIVANNITTYADRPDLIEMVRSRTDNSDLPDLLQKVINKLSWHNAAERQRARIAFAREQTYERQIERIEQLISQHASRSDHEKPGETLPPAPRQPGAVPNPAR